MSSRHLLDGTNEGDDLVAAILRAIALAESSRSGTTVKLLQMALLNEGVRLAANVPQEKGALAVRKEPSPAIRLNLVAQDGNRL